MAKVTIPDKICPHCGGNEWWIREKNNRFTYQCGLLKKELALRHYYIHIEKMRNKAKKYREDNRIIIRLQAKENGRKYRKNVTDNYIKSSLQGLFYQHYDIKIDRKVITNEQVENYRQSLLIQRKLKQLKHENK